MKTLENFPMEIPLDLNSSPIAIWSGTLIHVIYPDGNVGFITEEELIQQQLPKTLENCLVWGRFEEF